ncbi:MAG: putative transcriptional regulator [Acidimicrobiaceae bacterium]
MRAMPSTKGRLLVASPLLNDPNFERTVILMLEHAEEGALGVVLNRPSALDVHEALPDWARFTGTPEVVFVGGPVGQGSVIGLSRCATEPPEGMWQHVLGAIGVLDLSTDADEVGAVVDAVRVFTGYAGWGGGQLEGELTEGAWFVVDADEADPMSQDPEGLWRTVLRRQPPPLNRYAMYPPNPNMN